MDEYTQDLRKLVEVILLAYKNNPYFYNKFAWDMWADKAEETLDNE